MPQATYSVNLALGGVSINRPVTRTGDHPNSYEVTLPAGKAGTLTTRTDDNTGEATLSTGHGIVDGDVVDVYWSGGIRYGMTVGTVATNVVPVDGGAGDNLPAQSTALVVTKQVTINTAIDGDAIEIIGICAESTDSASTSKAHIDMRDSGNATIEEIDLVANVPQIWDIEGGATNVFTGNPITNSKASNGSSSESLTLKIVSLEDSTP